MLGRQNENKLPQRSLLNNKHILTEEREAHQGAMARAQVLDLRERTGAGCYENTLKWLVRPR